MEKIRVLEIMDYTYNNIEVESKEKLIRAIENSLVIPIYEKGKKIYINGDYIMSFSEWWRYKMNKESARKILVKRMKEYEEDVKILEKI